MVLKSDEEDFGPEIPVEAVLRFDNSEIVASGNHAPIEEDEVFISGNKDHGLSTAGEGEEQNSTKDYTDLANKIIGHRSEAFWGGSALSHKVVIAVADFYSINSISKGRTILVSLLNSEVFTPFAVSSLDNKKLRANL